MEPKCILTLWRSKKLSHKQAIEQLHVCRGSNIMNSVRDIRYHEEQEKLAAWSLQRREVCRLLQLTMRPFIQHPVVLSWKQQYEQRNYDVLKRFNTLLLRGPTQLGKTSYAESIFGEVATLTLQRQGLGKNLPSLREFCGDTHKCIVFYNVDVDQILGNKGLFQAGKNVLELSQSKCDGFRYSVWPYQTAMICCSNNFPVSEEEGLKAAADINWITHNTTVVELAEDQTWFVPAPCISTMRVVAAGACSPTWQPKRSGGKCVAGCKASQVQS